MLPSLSNLCCGLAVIVFDFLCATHSTKGKFYHFTTEKPGDKIIHLWYCLLKMYLAHTILKYFTPYKTTLLLWHDQPPVREVEGVYALFLITDMNSVPTKAIYSIFNYHVCFISLRENCQQRQVTVMMTVFLIMMMMRQLVGFILPSRFCRCIKVCNFQIIL